MMKGYKTWIAAGLAGVSAILTSLGYVDIAKVIITVAAGFGFVGIGHKIQKAAAEIKGPTVL
ncbi:MAG: hypothetical protein QF436_04195 [Candidatus Woesearchaeota archaeon]|jgi:hypothetical protein|nr:hypothetical protein [Candidatus Woesearchaeota archaeon]|tara:strand:+ start:101 stop:286 length:186 start_codon:yes stop_codon:yes gene_type:complete